MKKKREYRLFSWKNALYRISSPAYEVITREIKRQRHILETYIAQHPLFKTAMEPIPLVPDMPPIVRQMAEAGIKTGVGPMAAVAGAMAQAGVTAAMNAGAYEGIVENGGDIYLAAGTDIVVGLYPGGGKLTNTLALLVKPHTMPVGICSSSSYMGHSKSFGKCNLATVIAGDCALADAAATLGCNSVKKVRDIALVLEKVIAVPGIDGVILIKDDHIGMIGNVPEIVKNRDPDVRNKITRDPGWKL